MFTRPHLFLLGASLVLWGVVGRGLAGLPLPWFAYFALVLAVEAGWQIGWSIRRWDAARRAGIPVVSPKDWDRWLRFTSLSGRPLPQKITVGVARVAVTQFMRLARWRFTGRLVWLWRKLWRFGVAVWRLLRWRVRDAKRLSRVRRKWAAACLKYGVYAERWTPGQGRAMRLTPWLWKVRITVRGVVVASCSPGRMGVELEKLEKNLPRLAQGIGCRRIQLKARDGDFSNGLCDLQFWFGDPLRDELLLSELPASPEGTIAYGIRADEKAAWIWQHQTTLIGGLTRKGKSVLCRTLMADLIRKKVPVRFYIVDLKDGIELPEFEWAMREGNKNPLFQIAGYARDVKTAEQLLGKMQREMQARAEFMRNNRIKQLSPSQRNPLLIGVIDETLPWPDMLKKGTEHPAGQIAFTGAARCVALWLNAQTGEKTVLGSLRDLIPQRITFAVKTWQQTDMLLGDNAHSNGATPHLIGDRPGLGFSASDDSTQYVAFRSPRVTDAETLGIAQGEIPGMRQPESKTAWVYRMYSKDRWVGGRRTTFRRLEYIGKTTAPEARFKQHRETDWKFCPEHRRWENWWAIHVDETRVKWEGPFASEAEALAVEEAAIKAERPYWNVRHNHRNPRSAVRLGARMRRRHPDPSNLPAVVEEPLEGPVLVGSERR